MSYDPDDLTNAEQAVLKAAHRYLGDSLNARAEKETIKRYLPRDLDNRTLKRVDKAFKALVAKGLLVIHPSGNTTYQFSRDGQHLAQDLDSD